MESNYFQNLTITGYFILTIDNSNILLKDLIVSDTKFLQGTFFSSNQGNLFLLNNVHLNRLQFNFNEENKGIIVLDDLNISITNLKANHLIIFSNTLIYLKYRNETHSKIANFSKIHFYENSQLQNYRENSFLLHSSLPNWSIIMNEVFVLNNAGGIYFSLF